MQSFAPSTKTTFQGVESSLKVGSNEADHYYALVAACDLLTRTVQDRKLQAARKSIVLVSPFAAATAPVDGDTMVRAVAPDVHRSRPSFPCPPLQLQRCPSTVQHGAHCRAAVYHAMR